MAACFVTETDKTIIPITLIPKQKFATWLSAQAPSIRNWFEATQFKPEPGMMRMMPDPHGNITRIYCCVSDTENLWDVGGLPLLLPEGIYQFDVENAAYAIAWGLGAYQFNRYKAPMRMPARLFLSSSMPVSHIQTTVDSIYLVRDLINTPTDDMGPTQFAEAAKKLANEFDAQFSEIVGEALLLENYASIYTVGRASDDAPRLIDIRWGDPNHPKITLVGKGVCFDSGGLDIKPSSSMLLMKKDMAGGAHVLGLARMIMATKLPICLRVLIPVVENVISGNAYRPGDIIKSRKGLTIEIGNTDAEGRVILADALAEAASENPELLIDITTLTGAARIALGLDLPALFSNNDELAHAMIKQGIKLNDPVWQMPLYTPYRDLLNSNIADINNNSSEPYGGAITAAVFLKEFVANNIPWVHFDMMAWNLRTRPGRPQGGEAMAIRALFGYLQEKYA